MAGVEGIEPSQAGFGDPPALPVELHACVGTNWRTRTTLPRSTAVCHHQIGLVGMVGSSSACCPRRKTLMRSPCTLVPELCVGRRGWVRTTDLRIQSAPRYQLRHSPVWRPVTVTIRLYPLERRVS
jgi:hypothetical protein